MDEELREFSARKKQEEETLRNLFTSGDALKKQEKKIDRLTDDLKRFKDRPSRRLRDNPFEDD